jgi:signal transduction histidine kinase/ActR/RegA family two-component response regulator
MLKILISLGIYPSLDEETANRIRFTNTLAILPVFLSLFYIGLNLYFRFYPSLVISAAAFILLVYVLWLNKKFRYRKSRYVLITTLSLYLLTSYFIVKQTSGIFFFYPVILLSFFILFDHSKELKDIYFNLAIVGTCMSICIFMPRNIIPGFNITGTQQVTGMFVSKLLVSGSYIFVFINVIKHNFRREKILREAKEKAEAASTAKAIFLSNMSHELRTPLNGIVGISNLVTEDTGKETLKENLATLSVLSDHMMNLVNDILDFSRLESGKLTLNPVRFRLSNLFRKLDSSFALQFRKKQIHYSLNLDPELKNLLIKGDELRLRQVLFNLISNALKFTPEKGKVEIHAKLSERSDGSVTIFFSVTDTGIGIDAAFREKIFESFRQEDGRITRKYGGSGLGLSIVQFLLQVMNGKIEVESEKRKGSKFYFTLSFPVVSSFAGSETELLPPEEIEQNNYTGLLEGKKIMLADDNKVNLMVAQKMLEGWGVIVSTAVNGKEAVELFANKPFDLLLIDLEMPVMDGKNATILIRNQDKHIPIIAFTAAVYEHMQTDLEKHGFNNFVLKPFKPAELKQILIKELQKSANKITSN